MPALPGIPKLESSEMSSTVVTLEGSSKKPVIPVCVADEDGQMYLPSSKAGGLTCFMRLNGNPVGEHRMNQTVYSLGSPGEFAVKPPAGWVYYINHVTVHIVAATIGLATYGGLATGALTNGCLLQIRSGVADVQLDILDGEPIRQNTDLALHAAKYNPIDGGAGQLGMISASINVREINGRPIRLSSALPDMRLSYILQDDCTDLDDHFVKIVGYKEKLSEVTP